MVDTLGELKKLLVLCREQGVTEIEAMGVSFKLGALPDDPSAARSDEVTPYENFPKGELTPTQLMYYSAGGSPEDDPENQELPQ